MSYSAYPDQPAYPGTPGPGGNPDPGKPTLRGRTPLRLAIVLFVVAVILFVIGGVLVAKKSFGAVDDFQRVSFSSGSGTITLNGTGKWIGYYEAGDVTGSIDRIPDFRIAITGPTGQPVTGETYGNRSDGKVNRLTYSTGGHHGAAAVQFDAPTKGTYRVILQAGDTLPSDAQVAFGRDIVKSAVAGGLFIAGGVLLLVTAVVLLIVGLVKRSRHKAQLAHPYGGGFGGPPPPPNYPPPGFGQPGYGQPGYGPAQE